MYIYIYIYTDLHRHTYIMTSDIPASNMLLPPRTRAVLVIHHAPPRTPWQCRHPCRAPHPCTPMQMPPHASTAQHMLADASICEQAYVSTCKHMCEHVPAYGSICQYILL